MTRTLLGIAWLNLVRDRVALGLTFALPLVFFTIFAVIFSGTGDAGSPDREPLRAIVVDEDSSDTSRRLVSALREMPALSVTLQTGEAARAAARRRVRSGEAAAAVVIPGGFGGSLGSFGTEAPEIEILYDSAEPLARAMLTGLLARAAGSAAPGAFLRRGAAMLERFGGGLTDRQRKALETGASMLDRGAVRLEGPLRVRATDVREAGDSPSGPSMAAYYAAGIGVMFLLFSMAGAGGTLLEEEENATLERLLSSRVGMGRLLCARWLFFALVGLAQLTLMFAWGSAFFSLPLWTSRHLAGFLAMAVFTAAAAAAFGILLATVCRSRAQLAGISTVVILIMSALGGSMVPRFVMPAFMDTTALFTFNGWALDGFLKVFWYDDPGATVLEGLAGLLPQLAVLLLMTAAFLGAARLSARRWETA